MTLRLALIVVLCMPFAVGAQEAPAVDAARQYLAEATGIAPQALGVADVHTDRASGAEIVHLIQQHLGVPIWGTASAVAVLPTRAVASGDAFVEIDAARAADAEPSVTPSAARAAALARAGAGRTGRERTRFSDAPGETQMLRVSPLVAVGEPVLVYQPVGDALRLAWAVTVEGEAPLALWSIRVDAHTGAVLAADDLVVREPRRAASPRADVPTATTARGGGGPAYRVIPFPFESPLASPFVLVPDPAARGGDASPFGWHDTDGADGAESTLTTGNNARAYIDPDDTNNPSPGSQPDGGPALVFDFAYDPEQQPEQNTEASVVNLFYWTNVLHDVLWAYGFDEPAGNFQINTYGRGGDGGDAFNAESQDGPIFLNAEYVTPIDGRSPRMELFTSPTPPAFSVDAPGDIAGEYLASGAGFGPEIEETAGVAVVVRDAEGAPGRGCTAEAIANAADINGEIAVVERGDCDFVAKARVAQALGATGLVVTNCEPGADGCSENRPGEGLVTMACPSGTDCSDVTLVPAFVQRSTGLILAAADTPQARLRIFPDSDYAYSSSGTAYQYGRGLADRLTGGRLTADCLSNIFPGEQMGVGWGDYFGLMMTMQPEHSSTTPRGIGTYPSSLSTEGEGFRPAVYTTDFAVNGYTYQDVIDGTVEAPHGVGFVWGSMIWDMTWALIDQNSVGDLYDADGGAGNQTAMQLVVTAMKLQPCRPGFVDARDAIFAADALLYDSAHSDAIGDVFAARGLGFLADQGSPQETSDGVADFSPFPPFVAGEPAADASSPTLAVTGPNPFRDATSLTLRSARPEPVTVDVLDLLGRRVATLFDGTLRGDAALTLSADALPAGVYVVRAVGETFGLTERVTVLR